MLACDAAGIVTWADERAERLLGARAGGRFLDLVAPGHADRARRLLRHRGEAALARGELTLVTTERPVAFRVAAVPVAYGMLLVGRRPGLARPGDLAALRSLLTGVLVAHRASERRARELIAERDDLLALVAHDLKNPLTAIQGLARLVRARLTTLTDPADPRLLDQLAAIDESVAEMRRLVEQLLDLACAQRGQPLALARQPTDLVAIANALVVRHQRRAPRHRLEVRPGAPDLVGNWDPARIERVVDNLIHNAVAYSPAGGAVSVTLRRQVDADGAWAVLEVRDEGIGIPAADLPRIFEPFQRGSNVPGHVGGTGLGLAGVRWIVEQHRGMVAAASVEGGGTTITVRLPLGQSAGDPGS